MQIFHSLDIFKSGLCDAFCIIFNKRTELNAKLNYYYLLFISIQ